MRIVSLEDAVADVPMFRHLKSPKQVPFERECALSTSCVIRNALAKWMTRFLFHAEWDEEAEWGRLVQSERCRAALLVTDMVFRQYANTSAFRDLIDCYAGLPAHALGTAYPVLVFDEREPLRYEALPALCLTNIFDVYAASSNEKVLIRCDHHDEVWIGGDAEERVSLVYEVFKARE